ncbi:protein-disulfide reductase DsbD family protein [Psychromonas antarctica]|uniref:protein-disulfide reductase DsbD family protein n=1 Tax=Psychromonas antarctica TaxID=67573 RepID=UPI001EE93DDD|nr:protein-disulfide reductase DsbD domain-containing protein [Psychromonas antarctica]MCG6200051.1 thioredoxin family protein [Psychromonas antarctica]
MNRFIHSIAVSALLIVIFFSSLAQAREQSSTGWLINPNHPPVSVQMQLTGQSDPLLQTVNGVLQLRLEDDWKTYWRSPGDGGVAPAFDFSPSTNIDDVVWGWPAPKRYPVLGVETLGYKGVINFPLTLYVQDVVKPVRLKGRLTIASCTNICVLSDYDIELNFTPSHLLMNSDALFTYNQAVGAVPMKIDRQAIEKRETSSTISGFRSAWDNQKQILIVQVENKLGWQLPDIFIDSSDSELDGVNFSAPKITFSGDQINAQVAVSSWSGRVDLNNKLLNVTVIDKDLAVEFVSQPTDQLVLNGSNSLLSIFIFALVGGLILNIMPCVLPVLGMKLSSILSAHGIERKQIRRQFIASSLGILTSFWLLAVFLLLLKFSGEALGWGIQFQSPYFIAVMVVVTALFAANMLGLFEIQLPTVMQTWLASKGSHSYLGHFLQGMFATLLATPCSAPFLGTAVAFALGGSALQLCLIFTALGLGMALPWLLIAVFPALVLWLPKPGQWMNTIKTIFALMMLITSYWLLSLLSSFIGNTATLSIALLLTLLLLFLIGTKRGKKVLLIVLATILVSSLAITFVTRLSANRWAAHLPELQWVPLDSQQIAQQVKLGHVVFVDVTADWCVTCKANKIGVLLQDPVYSALQNEGTITMKGDWTHASKDVTEYLQSYGRFGVPFNIVYGPGAEQGIPLATILSSDSVLTAIQQAKGK